MESEGKEISADSTVDSKDIFCETLKKTIENLKNEKVENTIFSQESKEFIVAMYNIAIIKVDSLDKSYLEENVSIIKKYVEKNLSANSKVNNMFGFKNSGFSRPNYNSKAYYFFLADLKIKCTVYLLRIHNFITNWEESNSIKKQREIFLKMVESIKINSVRKVFGKDSINKSYTFKDIIESDIDKEEIYLEDEEAAKNSEINNDYREFYYNIIEFLKENNNEKRIEIGKKIYEIERRIVKEVEGIYDTSEIPTFANIESIYNEKKEKIDFNKEYYLFDNSMKEIDFVGIQWSWLWRYEQDTSDLFRCVGTDNFKYYGEYNIKSNKKYDEKNNIIFDRKISGRIYYQTMIKNIVCHMNKGDNKNKLASYSKNPFRDIRKYMNIKSDKKMDYFFIIEKFDNNSKIDYKSKLKYGTLTNIKDELPFEDNKNNVIFAMVKNAKINIARKILESRNDSHNFTINEKDHKVDINKESISFFKLIRDSEDSEYGFCIDVLNNKALYRGDVRNVFGKYVSKFPEIDVNGLQRNIVSPSDDEVVMLGNTCDAIEYIDGNNISYDSCKENYEYRLELNSKEMIHLFYSIYRLINKKDNINIILEENKNDKENIDINSKYYRQYKIRGTEIGVYVEEQKEANENDKDEVNEKKKYKYDKEYKRSIENSINTTLENILSYYNEATDAKVKFICSFLKESDYREQPTYGTVTCNEDTDQFICFCREYLLK